jgi:hypothetical protein
MPRTKRTGVAATLQGKFPGLCSYHTIVRLVTKRGPDGARRQLEAWQRRRAP